MKRSALVIALLLCATGVAAAWMWATQPPTDPCWIPPNPAEPHPGIDKPSDGSIVRSPWHLVRVAMPRMATIQVCLDGKPFDDPGAMAIPMRAPAKSEYIATLDLTGLEAGPHTLTAAIHPHDGEPSYQSSTFNYARRAHRVHVRVTDGEGRPTSARVVVTNGRSRFKLTQPNGRVPGVDRDRHIYSFFAVNGQGTVYLDPGHYRLLAVRSLFDDLGEATIDLDGDVELDITVPTAVPTPEYLTADLHVHTARSYDSRLPHTVRFQSLVAAGLDVAVLTDHNAVTHLEEIADAVRGDTPLHVIPGIEADMRFEKSTVGKYSWDLGHFNAFPLVDPTKSAPLPGRTNPSMARHIDDYRARQAKAPYPGAGKRLVLQLNHPRGIHFAQNEEMSPGAWPAFEMMRFNPRVPIGEGRNAWMVERREGTGTSPLDWDAVELVNRFSMPSWIKVRQDWFALMNQGRFITATGNSDSHAMEMEVAGFTVNLVRMPRPEPGEPLDLPVFLDAIKGGRVLVSTGPLVEISVEGDGGRTGLPGDMISGVNGATATARVRAAPWVPLKEVRIVVNGQTVLREPVTARRHTVPFDRTYSLELPAGEDVWVVAEAGWPIKPGAPQPHVVGDYALAAPPYVPIGFTNPVRIDGDGDGAWTPPGI